MLLHNRYMQRSDNYTFFLQISHIENREKNKKQKQKNINKNLHLPSSSKKSSP